VGASLVWPLWQVYTTGTHLRLWLVLHVALVIIDAMRW